MLIEFKNRDNDLKIKPANTVKIFNFDWRIEALEKCRAFFYA
jgi:hypothetical protein